MNIFLDCGFYIGHALKKYQEAGVVDESWKIYAFEPYPKEDMDKLLEAKLPLKVELIEKAVWTEDGKINFILKGREDAHHIDRDGPSEGDKVVTVETMDFPKFVADLPKGRIICSMDIEGSEFPVLEKMLEDGSIDRINELDIEFHHRLMLDKDEKDAEKLMKQIKRRGIKLRLKVPLI